METKTLSRTLLQYTESQRTQNPRQYMEKFVSLSDPIIVPTVTCVNIYPSERKQEGKCETEVCYTVLSGRGISGATLISVFTQ